MSVPSENTVPVSLVPENYRPRVVAKLYLKDAWTWY